MKQKLKVLDLFSGIGGFSLGLERTGGFETVAFCEIDPFCQKVLKKHWPEVRQYHDITTARFEESVDLVTGGFPCQDISEVGKRTGISGERTRLFWHILRAVRMVGRPLLLLENVADMLNRGMGDVLGAMAEIGHDAEWNSISAAYVGLPQLRDRVFIVANPSERPMRAGWVSQLPKSEIHDWKRLVLPTRGRKPHGIPNWLDRVGACGNSVVSQIPEAFGHAILAAEGIA